MIGKIILGIIVVGLVVGATYAFIVPAVRDFKASRQATSSVSVVEGIRGLLGAKPVVEEPVLPIAPIEVIQLPENEGPIINSDEFAIFDVTSTIVIKNPNTVTSSKPIIFSPIQLPGNPIAQPSLPNPEPTPEPITPPYGFTLAQLSQFYGKVRISGFSMSQDYATPSTFSLSGDGVITKEIDIRGWKLRGNKGADVVVPGAVRDYNPVTVPTTGALLVNAGTTVQFWSSKSPVDLNFRLNKCTGYFNKTDPNTGINLFDPELPRDCPVPFEYEALVRLSGVCQDFIRSLSSCYIPTPEEINSVSIYDNGGCSALAQKVGYYNCYAQYHFIPEFFSNEWRVWLNRGFSFDPIHDQLLLLDTQNLLVDRLIY